MGGDRAGHLAATGQAVHEGGGISGAILEVEYQVYYWRWYIRFYIGGGNYIRFYIGGGIPDLILEVEY